MQSGTHWLARAGGAWLVGPLDQDNLSTGSSVYLYPDMTTALLGDFRAGRLLTGGLTRLTGTRSEFGLPSPECGQPGPTQYRYRNTITSPPPLPLSFAVSTRRAGWESLALRTPETRTTSAMPSCSSPRRPPGRERDSGPRSLLAFR